MGNIIKYSKEEASYDKQELNLLRSLNEDALVLLTSYLSVRDLLNFSATCKYYQYVYLGPNSTHWAQMCKNIGGSSTIIGTILANSGVLKEDLEKIYKDKEKMKSVDFKRVIREYYIFVLNKQKLRESLKPFIHDTNAWSSELKTDVHPFNNWTALNQYWTSLDLAATSYSKDYYYIIDLEVDPASLEKISSTAFPQMCQGRLVLYKKSTRIAITQAELLAGVITAT